MFSKKIYELSYVDAIHMSISQLMEKDEKVLVIGQGVDDPKGTLGTTRGLDKIFGKNRCFDVPIAEESVLGVCIGLALGGYRPINVHIRCDFLFVAMNQLVNMASKLSYMSSGENKVPIIIRASIGRSWGQGAQHSQTVHSIISHIPGIKVYMPVSPLDAYQVFQQAYKDNCPTLIIEHRMLYSSVQSVSKEQLNEKLVPTKRILQGEMVTIVALSHTVNEAIQSMNYLNSQGITADLFKIVDLFLLDLDNVIQSVEKTKHLIIIDNDWVKTGISAEIAAHCKEKSKVDFKLQRMGFNFSPCPTTRCLEDIYYPSASSITETIMKMLGRRNIENTNSVLKEINDFRGPF